MRARAMARGANWRRVGEFDGYTDGEGDEGRVSRKARAKYARMRNEAINGERRE